MSEFSDAPADMPARRSPPHRIVAARAKRRDATGPVATRRPAAREPARLQLRRAAAHRGANTDLPHRTAAAPLFLPPVYVFPIHAGQLYGPFPLRACAMREVHSLNIELGPAIINTAVKCLFGHVVCVRGAVVSTSAIAGRGGATARATLARRRRAPPLSRRASRAAEARRPRTTHCQPSRKLMRKTSR